MKFTTEQLKELNPCSDGLKWYLENIKTENLEEILIQLNNHRDDWPRWLMVRVLDDTQRRKLAIFAASEVLHIFEEKYPDDKRPREAIEAAQKYLDKEITLAELKEKRVASVAAVACGYAAFACGYAAVAASAASAASVAAVAAANAANAAAYYAADAARKEMQEKIIRYAIKLRGEK